MYIYWTFLYYKCDKNYNIFQQRRNRNIGENTTAWFIIGVLVFIQLLRLCWFYVLSNLCCAILFHFIYETFQRHSGLCFFPVLYRSIFSCLIYCPLLWNWKIEHLRWFCKKVHLSLCNIANEVIIWGFSASFKREWTKVIRLFVQKEANIF